MYYEIAVLSEDAVFARMLELEFSNLEISVMAAVGLQNEDHADVVILDLDSATAPRSQQYRRMIGFSRRPAMTSPDARSCSMILRRPFRMSLLRREVLEQLRQKNGVEIQPYRTISPQKRQIALSHESRKLICDGQEIPLTAKEYALMDCLLKNRGNAVSGAGLSRCLGIGGQGNEINVYVCYLRRKTDELPNGRLIQTVRGKGYRIL